MSTPIDGTDSVIIADTVEVDPPDVIDEGDVVVEVVASDDASDAVELAATIDHEGRIAALEAENARLAEELIDARLTAEVAASQSNMALDAVDDLAATDEAIIEATDDAIVETIEGAELEDTDNDGDDEIVVDEIAPVSTRVHPMFRSWAEWRNRN